MQFADRLRGNIIQTLSSIGEALFPERQISVRSRNRIWQIALPGSYQAALAATLALGIGTTAIGAWRSHEKMIDSLHAARAELIAARRDAETAKQSLRSLAAASDDAAAAPNADGQALAQRVSDRIAGLEQALKESRDRERAIEAERDRLAAGQEKAEQRVAREQPSRDKAPVAAHHMKLIVPQTAGKSGGKLIIVGQVDDDDQPEALPGEPETGGNRFDLEGFMARLGLGARRGGVGGPFVALGPGAGAPSRPDPAALALLNALPLSAPLDQYQFESSFGVRVDPINGHRAMHTGIDLSGPYRAPVYSTSPGAVTFAGYAMGYGKMVEIDHGNGIHTRYAHLNRVTVNVGQHVGRHAEIGLLGSTGRSTGPHVHYEVLVNGRPQDPSRFLRAGKSVQLLKTAG